MSGPGWADVLDREEWPAVLLSSGVWLVFLVWPIANIVMSDLGRLHTALCLLAVLAFMVVYLMAMVAPRPIRVLPRWANGMGYTAVMVGLTAVMFPGAGSTIVNTAPYLIAIWLFTRPLLHGLIAGSVIAVCNVVVLGFLAPVEEVLLVAAIMGLTLVIMFALRFGLEKEETARALHQEIALSHERERFARDVHDVVGHSLTVISVKAELAARLVNTQPERAVAELDDVQAMARQALDEVRSTIDRLQEPTLNRQIQAARTALDAAGITARLPSVEEVAALMPAEQELFAWVVRESVTNIIRHSDAGAARIEVGPGWLTVSDDGVGLPEDPRGTGISGMRQRISEAGGTLHLRPLTPGADSPGTIVEVRA